MAKHAYPKQGGKHAWHRYGWRDFRHEFAMALVSVLIIPARFAEAVYG